MGLIITPCPCPILFLLSFQCGAGFARTLLSGDSRFRGNGEYFFVIFLFPPLLPHFSPLPHCPIAIRAVGAGIGRFPLSREWRILFYSHSRESGNLPVIWGGAGNARPAPLIPAYAVSATVFCVIQSLVRTVNCIVDVAVFSQLRRADANRQMQIHSLMLARGFFNVGADFFANPHAHVHIRIVQQNNKLLPAKARAHIALANAFANQIRHML